MKLILSAAFLFSALLLNGAVTAAKLPDDKLGNPRWKLENKYITAVFSAKGGMLTTLTDRKTGKELTGNEGAFRDQFAPANTAFADSVYRGQFVSGKAGEKVLSLSAPALDGANHFLLVTKKYILRDGESKLTVEVTVENQTESMQDRILEFWSNSFFGVEKTANTVFVPLKSGVHKELSGSNIFYKEYCITVCNLIWFYNTQIWQMVMLDLKERCLKMQ